MPETSPDSFPLASKASALSAPLGPSHVAMIFLPALSTWALLGDLMVHAFPRGVPHAHAHGCGQPAQHPRAALDPGERVPLLQICRLCAQWAWQNASLTVEAHAA